ncbi:MAG: GNAT family N-acetyltransferase [Acidimicrobiales bacterium]
MTDIRPALLTDRTAVMAALADAFHDDPVHAWIFEDEAVRSRYLPEWFGAMIDMVPPGGRVDVVDDCSSVAIWHAPAEHGTAEESDDELPPIAQLALDALGLEVGMDKLTKLAPLIEGHPEQPHWYLGVLGSDSGARGKGQGSALLSDRLALCDAEGLPAYLESSNPRNVPLYARHGFEVTESFDLDDGGPLVSLM